MTAQPKKFLFESETCSRCDGSGRYSYCERWGTTCFKCRGRCIVLTKRGAAAQAYLDALQSKPARELVAGDLIEHGGITQGGALYTARSMVLSMEAEQPYTCERVTNGISETVTLNPLRFAVQSKTGDKWVSLDRDAVTRYWPNTPANVAKALEYQATLTKTGTVSKRKVSKD